MSNIQQQVFGTMPDGEQVDSFTLSNNQGSSVTLLTLGATIQSWKINDHNGQSDIVLGFDKVEGYLADQGYIGRTVGRYANRIANGRFCIDGTEYNVSTNLQGNSLHGGVDGFHNRIWSVGGLVDDSPSVTLNLLSPDGDQGFPGNLEVKVTFTLDDDNCLSIEYYAQSDKDTLFNPTQHSYFNLAGHDSGDILSQQVRLMASHYTPADEHAIPTGEIISVKNTAFDLTQLSVLAERVKSQDPEIKAASGLDHNWCIDGFDPAQHTARTAATIVDPKSARKLIMRTTMPGVQVYTANFLGDTQGKEGALYGQYHGVCLESQFYPNSPNEPGFPSPVLRKDSEFRSTTTYQLVATEH